MYRIWFGLMLGAALATASSAQMTKGTPTPANPYAPFTEEAALRGVSYSTPDMGTSGVTGHGAGVALVDLDRDRDLDLVTVGRGDGLVGLFENDGTGHFTDRSSGSGIPLVPEPSGIVALDYDADGDLDLYLAQGDAPNILVQNLGGFAFLDVSSAAGVDDGGPGTGPSAGDFDGDGWLDLHVANYGTEDRLYRNKGDGTFEDVATAQGVADDSRAWQSVFFDMDWDGDADLYVSNDKKVAPDTTTRNALYENVGGAFVDISAASGTNCNIYSMGVGVGDFDGNGLQDLYCTNVGIEPNYFFANGGGGSFVEAHVELGVESYRTGWGAVFFDFDNDSFQDLYVCNIAGRNRFYVHAGTLPAADVGWFLGLDDPGHSYVAAVGDIDDDGDMDVVLQNVNEDIQLFINHEGERRNWIKLEVAGQGANLFAIGAHVGVRIGGTWQHREILSGGNSFKAQHALTVHFGLGDAEVVDEVAVTWPGGSTRHLTNLAANATYTIAPDRLLRSARPELGEAPVR